MLANAGLPVLFVVGPIHGTIAVPFAVVVVMDIDAQAAHDSTASDTGEWA